VTDAVYTDRDARDEPILLAKRRVELGYALETAHVRMILNTMRSDPRVVMPERKAPVIQLFEYGETLVSEVIPESEEPRRPVILSGRLTIKPQYQYGYSPDVRNAYNIHSLTSGAYMKWQTPTVGRSWDYDWTAMREAKPQIFYACSQNSSRSTRHMKLLTPTEAVQLVHDPETIWRWCRTCQEFTS
jgi:hypothetical protein